MTRLEEVTHKTEHILVEMRSTFRFSDDKEYFNAEADKAIESVEKLLVSLYRRREPVTKGK